ncbi:hypothetical protein BKA80DRAFT_278354 [Phyllosticta citrichinensis]
MCPFCCLQPCRHSRIGLLRGHNGGPLCRAISPNHMQFKLQLLDPSQKSSAFNEKCAGSTTHHHKPLNLSLLHPLHDGQKIAHDHLDQIPPTMMRRDAKALKSLLDVGDQLLAGVELRGPRDAVDLHGQLAQLLEDEGTLLARQAVEGPQPEVHFDGELFEEGDARVEVAVGC